MTTTDTRRDVVISETEWLLMSGEDGSRIAAALGYKSPANLARALQRWGCDELAGRISQSKEGR